MNREIVHTDNAPAAVGPYSQAVKINNLVFTAGRIGLNPHTGEMAVGLETQTKQVLANIEAVLSAAGTDMASIIKTTIFLTDMADFGTVNAIYADAFDAAPPARSTVAVAALPLGALVEIEAIASLI
jgi:2-iminobutanoate/2-iminopropanoate deaminase